MHFIYFHFTYCSHTLFCLSLIACMLFPIIIIVCFLCLHEVGLLVVFKWAHIPKTSQEKNCCVSNYTCFAGRRAALLYTQSIVGLSRSSYFSMFMRTTIVNLPRGGGQKLWVQSKINHLRSLRAVCTYRLQSQWVFDFNEISIWVFSGSVLARHLTGYEKQSKRELGKIDREVLSHFMFS